MATIKATDLEQAIRIFHKQTDNKFHEKMGSFDIKTRIIPKNEDPNQTKLYKGVKL